MLESLIAAFLLGVSVGGLGMSWFYGHLRETRREIVRVNHLAAEKLAEAEAVAENRLALREAFFSAACTCPSPQTLMADCVVHGVQRPKLRAVK